MTTVVYSASDKALSAVRAPAIGAFFGVLRSSHDVVQPDIQLLFVDKPYFSPALEGPSDAYAIACSLMTPASRGSVRLAGSDIDVPPKIDPNYLADQRDVARLLVGLRLAREIGNCDSLKLWNRGEALPGPDHQDDEALTDYLRVSTMPYFHPTGTCRMGSDSGAVVDTALRVRGVEGLRVVDASIMPSTVSANTNATVVAIAERAAELIASEFSETPARNHRARTA